MAWKSIDKMSLRLEFVLLAIQAGANKRELMRRFNICPRTGYKWINRYNESGLKGLEELSRRPKSRHINQTEQKVENAILSLKSEYDYWGARKVRNRLKRISKIKHMPATSTVHGILKRHGWVGLDGPKSSEPLKRFERDNPNDLWQMDYKGHFGIGNGNRCHPLTACDDHSRYNLILAACSNEQTLTVQGHLRNAFERYGLPRQILCDNGSPWGCVQNQLTPLNLWLIQVGVDMIHGRPRHPQTQGKLERFHRTLKHELLSRTPHWKNLKNCQNLFDIWRDEYNQIRSHESIDDQRPADVYRASQRSYPSHIKKPTEYYLSDDVLRKVKGKGELTFKNQTFYMGKGFAGKYLALRKVGNGQWQIFFCWKSLGYIDFNKVTKSKNNYESILRNLESPPPAAAQQQREG